MTDGFPVSRKELHPCITLHSRYRVLCGTETYMSVWDFINWQTSQVLRGTSKELSLAQVNRTPLWLSMGSYVLTSLECAVDNIRLQMIANRKSLASKNRSKGGFVCVCCVKSSIQDCKGASVIEASNCRISNQNYGSLDAHLGAVHSSSIQACCCSLWTSLIKHTSHTIPLQQTQLHSYTLWSLRQQSEQHVCKPHLTTRCHDICNSGAVPKTHAGNTYLSTLQHDTWHHSFLLLLSLWLPSLCVAWHS